MADDDKTPTSASANAASALNTGNQASTSAGDTSKPGRRTYNPLGKYPSYTYNLTLYMITPKAYDAFINGGRLKIDTSPTGGAVIIAQSGGINSNVDTRGAGFAMDYYIDNLKITTICSGKDNATSTNTTEMSFTITEPYGFSFISNLKACADDLIAKSKEEGLENLDNSFRQFFILGIRFTGWNNDGTPASSKNDPLFERFYDIMITGMTFKLDNKSTVYNLTASTMAPGMAFGVKRGVWDTGGTLRGRTVYDMLKNMMDQMNKQSADLVKGKDIKPTTYSFKFMGEGVGDSDADQKGSLLFKSPMKSETEIGKSKLTGSPPDKTDGKAPRDQGQPDPSIQELKIESGTPILQAFELIISRSSYIEDAFKVIQTSALEGNDKKSQGELSQKTDNQNNVRWYNVSAECTNAKYSKDIADYTWDIKYVFTVYETPVIANPYSNLGIDYYGPHKRYDYWFTGLNSEILSYTQSLDNTFFNVGVAASNLNTGDTDSSPPVAVQTGKPQDAPKTGTQNQQQDMKKAYINSLFDPGAYASATVKIMGDPDFLMPETTTSVNAVYNQFYGTDGFTISPNGGQVFVEIDFKEPQDYGFKSEDGITYNPTNDGLLKMNDKIQFWNYPPEIEKIVKGVSYNVLQVASRFAGGKFEQDLNLNINVFGGYEPKTQGEQSREAAAGTSAENRQGQAAGGQGQAAAGTNSGTATNINLKQDPPPPTSGNGVATTSNATNTNSGQQSANDDLNPPLLQLNTGSILEGYKPTEVQREANTTGGR